MDKYEKKRKKIEEMNKMIEFIKEYKIDNYAVFFRFCSLYNDEWFKILVDYPNFYKYFKRVPPQPEK